MITLSSTSVNFLLGQRLKEVIQNYEDFNSVSAIPPIYFLLDNHIQLGCKQCFKTTYHDMEDYSFIMNNVICCTFLQGRSLYTRVLYKARYRVRTKSIEH